MQLNKVGILGLGAIGGLLAGQLYDYQKNSVYVLADDERISKYEKKEFVINDKTYDFQYLSPNNPIKLDLIIVAVKYHHLKDAIGLIRHFIHEDTIIMSLMNGINTEKEIGFVYGMERMLYSFIVEVSAVKEGQYIQANKGKIVYNSVPANNKNVLAVKSIFDSAGICYEIAENIMKEIWWKFMINVGINQTSAILDAPYGLCQQVPHIHNIMDAAMREVIHISQHEGTGLSEDDLQRFYPILMELNPKGMTSMLQDMRAKRKTEVEMFAGVVCDLGKQHGIMTPVNIMLFEMIRSKEDIFNIQ